ncbi:MAG TPA: insulinase family protein [Anaerolineae bacterium]|nr:insulinase family protein [Anaerolineae bacterium]
MTTTPIPDASLPGAPLPDATVPAATAAAASPSAAASWTLLSERPVPLLRLSLQHYRHDTGAEHFHLAADDAHCAFTVSFRTVPDDSTGLPHILEHLVLCGSERYPVRDPFFMMLRRSLNTFMNAMTGGDCTYYPFASEVAKDFDNLLSIYLDATFRPNLDPLDFAQEGFRLEPTDAVQREPGPTDWAFKGVVYNEMKGALGNSDAQLWIAHGERLFPDTPYRHESGGDPAVIPELTHQRLVDFHAAHYCAANACFATYGKLDVEALHVRFEPYLRHRPGRRIDPPALQPQLPAPQTVTVPVPLEAGQDLRDVSQARLTWVWGDGIDLGESLLGELVDLLLLGHAGAPLRLSLESSGLGRALSGSGYHTTGRNGVFGLGLKGIEPDGAPAMEALIMSRLEQVAQEGIADSELAAALHQLELARRTISGDRFPFGLDLAMRTTEAWLFDQDPLGFLDMGQALEDLRLRVGAPGFWPALIRERFLNWPHRALLIAQPDGGFNQRQDAEEAARLAERVAAMDPDQRQWLLEQTGALAHRQATEDDPKVLPDLALTDVPAERRWVTGTNPSDGLEVFVTATNGILHQVAALPLSRLSMEDMALLPLLSRTLGELGVAERSYDAQSAHLNAVCGGLSAWTDLRSDPADLSRTRGYLFLEVKGLARRHAEFADLLAETLNGQRFDELDRVREILTQSLAGLQQRVAWSGQELAQAAAERGFGGRAGLSHALGGLGQLARLKVLEARVAAEGRPALEALAEQMAGLLARIRRAPLRLALIGDQAGSQDVQARALAAWEGWDMPAQRITGRILDVPSATADVVPPTAYLTATQVNYCAMALPTVPFLNHDSAALAVAARYLTFNQLHTRLREQGGAYGGRAGYSAQQGSFGLTSYRDPRLADTYRDMRESLDWLREAPEDPQLMKEAILGVIGGLDRPGSPAGEGRMRFVADLFGYGPERMNDYRQQVLEVNAEAMRKAAADRLVMDQISVAVITSERSLDASGLKWEREQI